MIMNIDYIAGLFDGEGHCAYRNLKNGRGEDWYTVQVVLVQGTKNRGEQLLRGVGEHLGYGNISCSKKDSLNPCWRWQITGTKAVIFLESIKDKCFVKKESIDKCLNLWYSR